MNNSNQFAKHYESELENLKLRNESNKKIVKSAFETIQKENTKLKEDNGLMEIELRHTKTLLASCENALISRNEDNAALLDALSLILGSFALERVERFDIVEKCKAAIQKAESK